MTYDAYDTSVQDGQAVELYEFVMGAETWRYTSAAMDYSHAGHTWTAEVIERGEVEQSNEINRAGFGLNFPRSNTFAAQFLLGLQEQITTVTIWRGHAGDPDGEFLAYWKGRIAGVTADGAGISLNCESVYTSMRRPGLRARYQRTCRHSLYQPGCGVNRDDHAVTAAITSLIGTLLTVQAASDYPDGWFSGGYMAAPDSSLRFIMSQSGPLLLLSRAHPYLADLVAANGYGLNYGNYYGGVPVTLYPGCDHAQATCRDKFANLANYGGFPYIPGKNPLGGSSIV